MLETQESKFIAEHGGNPAELEPNLFILPDGATFIRGSRGDMSMYRDPPATKFEILRKKRMYLEARIEGETKVLVEIGNQLDQQDYYAVTYPMTCPPTPPQSLEYVKQRRKEIEVLETQLAEVVNELRNLPEQRQHIYEQNLARYGREQIDAVEKRRRERKAILDSLS